MIATPQRCWWWFIYTSDLIQQATSVLLTLFASHIVLVYQWGRYFLPVSNFSSTLLNRWHYSDIFCLSTIFSTCLKPTASWIFSDKIFYRKYLICYYIKRIYCCLNNKEIRPLSLRDEISFIRTFRWHLPTCVLSNGRMSYWKFFSILILWCDSYFPTVTRVCTSTHVCLQIRCVKYASNAWRWNALAMITAILLSIMRGPALVLEL